MFLYLKDNLTSSLLYKFIGQEIFFFLQTLPEIIQFVISIYNSYDSEKMSNRLRLASGKEPSFFSTYGKMPALNHAALILSVSVFIVAIVAIIHFAFFGFI